MTNRKYENEYQAYLKLPLATMNEESLIYKEGWVKITGLSFISPHPHRHYTYEEFEEAMDNNEDFLKFFQHNNIQKAFKHNMNNTNNKNYDKRNIGFFGDIENDE